MGEAIGDSHIYERDETLNIKNLSGFDFEKLTVTSAEGNVNKIVKIEDNIYKSEGGKFTYYFITNDKKTIMTELSVDNIAAYVKVLFCK